jgi:toxin YoeB
LSPLAAGRRQLLKRINALIKAIQRDPFQGIGKPGPVRHALHGYRSRRIDDAHRIVYKVEGDTPMIAAVRYHY